MTKILGKNVTLSIAVVASPEELELIGCGKECVLTTTTNIAGKSTVGSGIWQEFQGLSIGWTCSVTGFATFNENADMKTVRQLQFALTPVVMSFEEAGSETVIYSGFVIITSVGTTGNYNDAETYNVTLQGTGELQIT